MSQDCGNCAMYQAELTRLRVKFSVLLGQVDATARFMDEEQEKPSMPWRRLLATVRARIQLAIDEAVGRL